MSIRFSSVRLGTEGHWFVPKVRYVCGHYIYARDWLNDFPKQCPHCGADFEFTDMRDPK